MDFHYPQLFFVRLAEIKTTLCCSAENQRLQQLAKMKYADKGLIS
jgi:hypothetical protein